MKLLAIFLGIVSIKSYISAIASYVVWLSLPHSDDYQLRTVQVLIEIGSILHTISGTIALTGAVVLVRLSQQTSAARISATQ